MKAWQVRVGNEFYCTVVVAETRGKAKSEALGTDTCKYASFLDIEARRIPTLDSYYHGNREMDWNNPHDRLMMVKEAGMYCEDHDDECDSCAAKEYCQKHLDYLEWLEIEKELEAMK